MTGRKRTQSKETRIRNKDRKEAKDRAKDRAKKEYIWREGEKQQEYSDELKEQFRQGTEE